MTSTTDKKINLEEIKDPTFIKNLSPHQLEELSSDIRSFIIEKVSKTGGHLASNLGTVELTIAMHYIFDVTKDKFIFDVSHQTYTHKILTGRAKDFDTLRKFNGLSGFASYKESPYDHFESGHSSTSLSAQCGYLIGKDDPNQKVIALIGDASILNGTAMEALNYMGESKNKDINPIIILNDNKMSISPSIGAVSRSLSRLRSSKLYQKVNNFFAKRTPTGIRNFFHRIKRSIKGFILQENYFEDMGFDYMGPYDGNNLAICIKTLRAAKMLNKPCIVHFVTKKGKGYPPAEHDDIGLYHGVGPFNISDGSFIKHVDGISNSKVVADFLYQKRKNEQFYVINPAMIRGSELEEFQKQYPSSLIDVGIAEENAAVIASTLRKKAKCVLMYYSTFSQRAYDYLLNDIGRSNVPLLILIDRADIVNGDGETHQGIYDLSMFSSMPNYHIYQGRDADELKALLEANFNNLYPTVIRYNKGYSAITNRKVDLSSPYEIIVKGERGYIFTYGENVDYIYNILSKNNLSFTLVNVRQIKPLYEEFLREVAATNLPIIIYENVIKVGSLSSLIESYILKIRAKNDVYSLTIPDSLSLPCGDIEDLRKFASLDSDAVLKILKSI